MKIHSRFHLEHISAAINHLAEINFANFHYSPTWPGPSAEGILANLTIHYIKGRQTNNTRSERLKKAAEKIAAERKCTAGKKGPRCVNGAYVCRWTRQRPVSAIFLGGKGHIHHLIVSLLLFESPPKWERDGRRMCSAGKQFFTSYPRPARPPRGEKRRRFSRIAPVPESRLGRINILFYLIYCCFFSYLVVVGNAVQIRSPRGSARAKQTSKFIIQSFEVNTYEIQICVRKLKFMSFLFCGIKMNVIDSIAGV